MKCTTVRPDFDCVFMTKAGCGFHAGACQPIVEKCEGCAHIIEKSGQKYCDVFPDPAFKWSVGYCNFATHIKVEAKTEKKINPLKASKRMVSGK